MKLRFLFSFMLGASLAASAQGYQDGVDNYNAGRLDVAKTILTNTINNAATDKAVSYYYLGNIDFVEGNVAGAKTNFEKGLQANPDYPYNKIGLGEVFLKNSDKASAQKLFDEVLKADKKNASLYAAVARAYWNVDPKVYEKDIQKNIEKAFKLTENKEPAVYMLQGDMAAKDGDAGEAAGKYEQAITYSNEKNIVNREAYVKYAQVYIRHRPDMVIQYLEELNEKEPNSGLAQRELAEKYYENRQYGKAWKAYERYVKNPNHFRQDEKRYASLLYSADQIDQSIEWANKILAEDPSEYAMYRILMLDYTKKKDYAKVVENGEKLFAAPGAKAVWNDYVMYGDALVETDRAPQAVEVFQKAVTLFPDRPDLLTKLSAAYQAAGDGEKAVETMKQYLDTGAASASDYYDMASRYQTLARSLPADDPKRREAAEEGLKYNAKALELSPKSIRNLNQTCALSLTANGDRPDQATVDAYNKMLEVLDSNPKNLESNPGLYRAAYYILGSYYATNGNKDMAKEYFNKYLQLNPDDTRVKSLLESL